MRAAAVRCGRPGGDVMTRAEVAALPAETAPCQIHQWQECALHVCHTVNVPVPALHKRWRRCAVCGVEDPSAVTG